MSVFTELVGNIKKRKNVLLLTGYLCDEMELGGRKLSDFAAQIALKLDLPVAATGSSAVPLKEKGVRATRKALAEMVNLTRFPYWGDPITAQRPEMMVFIGYPARMLKSVLPAVKGMETVVLGNMSMKDATFSLPDASLREYQKNLESLIGSL
ncbi:MAG: hypothetical protein AUK24_01790 [Syntrophaceae bacterium CG2_30_49_12]|nr:MAG: hypothetical protein AUK24_01790 [Syntrophaceae bacterium CG2_30_49_12]PJC72747.1 MAG: hypothetical protein CO012_11405 [Syntrophobacterales bacterium CG_4_8_14_3_um_filter_49_14]